MKDAIAAWILANLGENAHRFFMSYSTYVVIVGSALPQVWSAFPDDAKEAVYALVPGSRYTVYAAYAASFAYGFWKARNTAQGIDTPKT